MRYLPVTLILFIICISLYVRETPSRQIATASVVDALIADGDAFQQADHIRLFSFPADHGPHYDFKTEWWYYTGNITTDQGRHFGFQLTFFRHGLTAKRLERASSLGCRDIYFAHFAVSDIAGKRFFSFERYSREAGGLAGAQATPFKVWLDDWSALADGDGVRLQAQQQEIAIDLHLVPQKPVVLNGDQGLSQKGREKGNASYYYSQTRLTTQGIVAIKGEKWEVGGLSWLDREWGSGTLDKEQTGWDWFALQLADGREIMFYQLRLRNGEIAETSSGSLIQRDGSVHLLKKGDFAIDVLEHWQSDYSGVIYPCRWQVKIPQYNIAAEITPHQADQEMRVDFLYWEGAVKIEGQGISGNGYVEMVGYSDEQK